jgi:hypothetical protein
VGGSSGSDGIHSDGEVYDCAQNEWTLLPLQMVGEDQVLAGWQVHAPIRRVDSAQRWCQWQVAC